MLNGVDKDASLGFHEAHGENDTFRMLIRLECILRGVCVIPKVEARVDDDPCALDLWEEALRSVCLCRRASLDDGVGDAPHPPALQRCPGADDLELVLVLCGVCVWEMEVGRRRTERQTSSASVCGNGRPCALDRSRGRGTDPPRSHALK